MQYSTAAHSERHKTMESPKITIVITCHNLGRYLGEAVDSVLAQTFHDFEVIVVDDASTDPDTMKLLKEFQRPKTKVIHVEKRKVSAARNCGVREARGAYICCLDADDILGASYLEKAIALLDRGADVGFVGCWYEGFGEDTWVFKPESATLGDFLVENRAPISSVFRKKAWEEVGGYDEQFVGYEDWEFWINILAHGYRYDSIKEVLFRYRIRRESKIKKSDLPENRDAIMRCIIEKHRDLFQEKAIPILVGKERVISGLMDYQRQLREAQRWQRGQIEKLLEAKEWFLKQLENQGAVIADQRAEITRQHADIARLNAETARKQGVIDLKEHELRTVYSSKIWKVGCAFRDARHSVKGAVLLPYRIIDLGCPDSFKRFIRTIFCVKQGETIKRSFYKFPYHLADRVLPRKLKDAIPYQIRNVARAVFRTTDERLFMLEKWNGPLASVIVQSCAHGQHLEEALKSVSEQTYDNYEVVIVGPAVGGESQKVMQILRGHVVKACCSQDGLSLSERLNHAIKKAEGKYICCFEEGSSLDPTYLEKVLFLSETSKRDMVYPNLGPHLGDEVSLGDAIGSAILIFARRAWEKIGGYKYIGPGETKVQIDLDFIERALWYGFRPLFHSMSHTACAARIGNSPVCQGDYFTMVSDQWNRLSGWQSLAYIRENLHYTYLAKNPFINLI